MQYFDVKNKTKPFHNAAHFLQAVNIFSYFSDYYIILLSLFSSFEKFCNKNLLGIIVWTKQGHSEANKVKIMKMLSWRIHDSLGLVSVFSHASDVHMT